MKVIGQQIEMKSFQIKIKGECMYIYKKYLHIILFKLGRLSTHKTEEFSIMLKFFLFASFFLNLNPDLR